MPGESRTKRKWWHATLNIKDRESGSTIESITSVNLNSPAINANPYSVLAYPNFSCEITDIPVPSFYASQSPGYFVFRPSITELGASVINVHTYQDAINLNNRRIFEFKRTAAYSSCDNLSPSLYDTFAHETITNELSSNVFRYPTILQYTQIGCCIVELAAPSPELPEPGRIGRATRIWYLNRQDDGNGNYTYSLSSYDFSLLSGALVFRGDIDVSVAPGVKLYDITWIPTDNSLLVLASDGIRRVFPGSDYSDAVLGDLISISNGNILTSQQSIFPMNSSIESSYKPKMEYNIYENILYVFYPLKTTPRSGSPTFSPSIFTLQYSDNTGLSLLSANTIQASFSSSYIIGDILFPQDFQTDRKAYCAIEGNLTKIASSGIVDASSFNNGQFYGMFTMAFVQNPDESISDNVAFSTNESGQIFSINFTQGVTVDASISLGASPIGAASTINGEDARISLFPFAIGNSHWLFLIDISASMSDGSKLQRIKDALTSMMQSYVRNGDKITLIGFNDRDPIRVTKQLVTYADANEVLAFVNTFFVASGSSTNLCSVLANLPQQFNDLKSVFILSDGTLDDCGDTQSEWDDSIISPLNNLIAANPGVRIVSVGVSASNVSVLQYIGNSFGSYIDWR